MTLSDPRPGRRQFAAVEAQPPPAAGIPRLPGPPFRRAVPNYPGGSRQVLVSVASLSLAAFPVSQPGRHPQLHFRGLLRLHSRYGPLDRSTAQRRPLSRGSGPASRPAKPLVSYQINRQLSGWNLPPLVIRAFGAHRTDMEHTERYFQKIATTWKIVLHTFDNFAENCAIFLSPTGC